MNLELNNNGKRGWVVINIRLLSALSGIAVLSSGIAVADGWWPNTKAQNEGSIRATRHNLTMVYNTGTGGASVTSPGKTFMDNARNDYGEVCVYCHTPHGANTQIKAPIWNRTINTAPYQIYDKLRTLNQPIGQPGANSLTCLSCHDGTIAIDSVINMPGSGGFNSSQESLTTANKTWLDTWRGAAAQGGVTNFHAELGNDGSIVDPITNLPIPQPAQGKCTSCHNSSQVFGAPDYTVFVIGTDLKNDHPIGILFPTAAGLGIDFNQPNGTVTGKMRYFDKNGNNRPDTNEPRLYDTGEGPEVECASCHDPHGISINGPGTTFIPSFLRVSNGNANTPGVGTSSGLCLTCHDK